MGNTIRSSLQDKDTKLQEMTDELRREISEERKCNREETNKFRYDFDELVHGRVESVLTSLEEMEQTQKRKDRSQQQQLDTLESDLHKLNVSLAHVNGKWSRFKENSLQRQNQKNEDDR